MCGSGNHDTESIFRYILQARGDDRRDAVRIYADALEEAGDHDRAWMFRQEDCPLGVAPEELRAASRSRVVMQRIRGGRFLQGSPKTDPMAWGREKPQHAATLCNDFFVGVFPVTQSLYHKYAKSNIINDAVILRPDDPAEDVSWRDAVRFCNALSEKEGLPPYYSPVGGSADDSPIIANRSSGSGYRLLAESEWEYACRAGSAAIWPWGVDESYAGAYAWHAANSGGTTRPVGMLQPNAWGLYDMLGNVWEWCEDPWRHYPAPGRTDPASIDESQRAVRGGSWNSKVRFVRPAYRFGCSPTHADNDQGFRIARTIP